MRKFSRSSETARSSGQPTPPAGDYAEWLVWQALGGMLEPNSTKSHDITLDDGRRIQVKARVVGDPITRSQRQMSPFRSWDFDEAALIQFSGDDYSVVRAALVPMLEVQSRSNWVAHVNGHRAFMTEDLMSASGSRDVSDAVRAAAA